MSDTRLILHVKGTESETTELPREDVRAAIAEGRLSQTQLIWSPGEQAWKQARELPELVPGERLILHIKGTESGTRELAREAVRDAISRGEITHSQLIWSATDGAWKPVRELPDLLPGETLILHVKGTEAETRELPRPAIRAAISKGEITHSQLIWSPLDSSWKPVSQMPELMPGESLILHVKGTEADTTEMPRTAIRTAISQGKITHSQLIWSAPENQWKQVRDLPELLPSQKLAPAPARKPVPMLESSPSPASVAPAPRVAVAATPRTPKARPAVEGPPRVKVSSASAATPQARIPQASMSATPALTPVPQAGHAAKLSPQVRAAVAGGPQVAVGSRPVIARATFSSQGNGPQASHVVEEKEEGFHPVKWVCIGLGVLLFLLLLANQFLVNNRLRGRFADSSYTGVGVYAHYAAFVQPNVIVIHIPPSTSLTPGNITDFFVALAHSTPDNALTGDLYERVAITSGWTAQYTFSGHSWNELGGMQRDDAAARKDFILAQITDSRGEPLVSESTLNEAAQEAQRDRVWNDFISHFTKP